MHAHVTTLYFDPEFYHKIVWGRGHDKRGRGEQGCQEADLAMPDGYCY